MSDCEAEFIAQAGSKSLDYYRLIGNIQVMSLNATLHANRPRVRAAAKRLLKEFARLSPGDRIDDQPALRERLGFSNDTLSPAMKALEEMGVIRRQRGVGTTLLDREAASTQLWSIAIPAYVMSCYAGSMFFPCLTHALHLRLREEGFNCTLHPIPKQDPTLGINLNVLKNVVGDGRTQEIDGIISPQTLECGAFEWAPENGIAISGVLEQGVQGHGVGIDELSMITHATAVLAGQGHRKIALVGHIDNKPSRVLLRAHEAVRDSFPDNVSDKILGGGFGLGAGQRVAQKLLNMPAEERPDGLVLVDDIVAMGLANELVTSSGYRPSMAVQTIVQAPVPFALPVFRFEVDLIELARLAVETLRVKLYNPATPDSVRLVRPVFAGLTPTRLPSGSDGRVDFTSR